MDGGRTTPLGLRLADATSGAPLSGLRAWAWPAALDTLRATSPNGARGKERQVVREARAGQNGVLAWHDLVGYGGWAAGPLPTEPADPWDASYQGGHTVLVLDPSGRHHPVRLAVTVPRRDLVTWTWAAGDVRPMVRAWPTPTAAVPDGVAVVRARLWDPERSTPAAWALLECTANGHVATGLAGEDGEVVVFLPWPRPRASTPRTPLAEQSWPLTVRVRYGRLVDLRVPAPGTLPGTPLLNLAPRSDLPTLDAVEGQPLARPWANAARTVAFSPPALPIGADVLLASEPQPPAAPLATRETRLFVTP